MTKVTEIIRNDKLTVAQKNAELEKIGSTLRLDPSKNVITAEEEKMTVVNVDTGVYSGYGLMNMGGCGTAKVKVVDGKLEENVGFNNGYLYMGGHEFEVPDGEHLKLVK